MKKHFKINKEIIISFIITIMLYAVYYEPIKNNTSSICQLIIISTLCLMLIYLILKKTLNLYKENKIYLVLLMLILYYVINISTNILNLDLISKIIVFFLTFFISLNKKTYNYSKIKKNKILFALISIVITFLFVGHNLFLQNDIFSISLKNISLFLLFYIYIINFEIYFINIIIDTKLNAKQNYSKKDFIILLLIMFVIWTIVAFGFYPGNISSDGVDQIMQALGKWPLTNSHPVIMALIIRILYYVIKSTFFVILVQILFASLTFAVVFYEAIKKGINKKYIYLMAFIIAFMPNNYMMMTTLVKDVPYSVLIVLISYYIYKLLDSNRSFLDKKINYCLFPIVLVCCSLYRHNGKGVLLLTILSLLLILLKYKNKKIIILIVESIILYFLLNNIIFPSLYLTEKNQQSISSFNIPIQRAVGRLYNNNLTISNDSYEIVSRILSPEILGEYFNKYNNDTYYAKEVDIYKSNNKNKKNVSLVDLSKVYIECLKKYPYQTIKERTDATNLMWNVSMPIDGYNHRYVDGVWYPYANIGDVDIDVHNINLNNKEAYIPNNIITKCSRYFRDNIMGYQIFDWILWRTGIYWIIIILCSYALFINKKENLLILFPMIGNTLTLVASLSWQLYRYVYYVPLITIAYLIFTVLSLNKK